MSLERVQPVQQSGAAGGAGGHGEAARPSGRSVLPEHHTRRSSDTGLRQREDHPPSPLGLSVSASEPVAGVTAHCFFNVSHFDEFFLYF